MQLESIFDDAIGGVIVKDPNGLILYANKSYRRQFTDGQEIYGTRIADALSSPLRELSTESDRKVFQDRQPLSFTFSKPSKNGADDAWFHIAKIPILGASGSCLGLIGMTNEVARRDALALSEAPGDHMSPYLSSDAIALAKLYTTLTQRELQIMQQISHGQMNKNMASNFDVSVRTIENYRQKILTKLNIESSAQLIRITVQMEEAGLLSGILPPEETGDP